MQKSEFAVRNEDFALLTNELYEAEHYSRSHQLYSVISFMLTPNSIDYWYNT
jgi:hypothetical protein